MNAQTHLSLLISENGSVDAQKEKIVQEILNAFETPENWPLLDTERVALLKRLHKMARTVRRTEAATSAVKNQK